MRAEIDRIQAARDGADRDLLASEAAETHEASVSPVPLGKPSATLQRGVALAAAPGEDDSSSEDEVSPDTEDPTPRPTLRMVGSQRSAGRNGWHGDGAESYFVDDQASPPSHTGGLDPEAKPAYDAALALVNARQYDRALEALAAFLIKWPDHPYADNAMFWRGECYFAKGDYRRASEQYEGVVNRFPSGNKAADALLKLGMSHQKLGDPMKAKECFDRLAQAYPQSAASHRIPTVTSPAVTPSGPASEDHR